MFYTYNKKIMGFKNCHSLQPCSVTDEDPGADTGKETVLNLKQMANRRRQKQSRKDSGEIKLEPKLEKLNTKKTVTQLW